MDVLSNDFDLAAVQHLEIDSFQHTARPHATDSDWRRDWTWLCAIIVILLLLLLLVLLLILILPLLLPLLLRRRRRRWFDDEGHDDDNDEADQGDNDGGKMRPIRISRR